MIFDLSTLYEQLENERAEELKEWGDDPHFVPRFMFRRRDVYVEDRGGVFHFFTTMRPGVTFAIVHRDHAVFRFPDWRRRQKTERRHGGCYGSSLLQTYFNVRVYAGRPNHPGHDFMNGNTGERVHTTEWMWSDGNELRPYGLQVERVLDRKALKPVKDHINQTVEPARVVARLTESKTESLYWNERQAALTEAKELIAQGGEVDAAKLRDLLAGASWGGTYTPDTKKIDRTLRGMREELWRRLGAVQLVEKEVV